MTSMIPESVQGWTERLAGISTECANAFRAVAPQIAAGLEATAFDRWAGQGLTLAQAGWRGWECAAWYFKLSPQFVARLDQDGLARLIEPTLRVTATASHLGMELLRGAARFLEHDRHITLTDWAAAGERLIPIGRTGRLAAAYFETSPDVLPLTGLSEFREWTRLVHTLAAAAEAAALELIRQSPQHLEQIPPLARLKALRLAHALARRAPAVAGDVIKGLPVVLHAVHASVRDRLLDLAQRTAEAAPQHLGRLLKGIARLVQGLPEVEQDLLLGQCQRVTLIDAEAGTLLCEHLPDVLRQLAVTDVEAWVGHGLAALRENREAGLAFFALESQACRSQLTLLARIVYLQDVQGVLRLYASALAGRVLGVRPLAELSPAFQSKVRQFATTDGETVYLPARADQFQTRTENFRTYLVMAAHQAGYLEFGTFTFSLETLTQLLGQGEGERAGAVPFRSDFERFFAGFPRPSVARDIFYCLEDGRVDYLLRQVYRGLAPHVERVIGEALASRPPLADRPLWDAILEILLHLCGTGTLPPKLPRILVPLARFLRSLSSRVRQPQATVHDTGAATLEVYRLLEQLPNVRLAALGDLSIDGETIPLTDSLSMEAALQAFSQMAPSVSTAEEVAYQSPERLPHQGDLKPDLVQRKFRIKELSEKLEPLAKAGMPIPPELLRALLEQGIDLDIRGTGVDELDETSGLFVSDLEGKTVSEHIPSHPAQASAEHERVRDMLNAALKRLEGGQIVYRYDEWDYLMRDYRVDWCLVREKPVEGEGEGFVAGVLQEHAALIARLRKQFQLLKPELFKKLKRRDHGEEIDIDGAVEGIVDRRATGVPPERVYIKRDKREREVSTVFLIDLSASTDDPLEAPQPFTPPTAQRRPPRDPRSGFSGLVKDDGFYAPLFAAEQKPPGKRIIDVEREALVVMAEALESIGDEYAVYGFSGYGRENVELYVVKDFEERYSELVTRRIDALKPHRSTRMGPAIRHAAQKLQRRPARLKTLIVLSDGYPQDFDYGKDRRGKQYGIQDTKMALQEARRKRIHTFCITVDREGKAYLPEMCGEDHFIVIERVARLPQELPKIYRGLTT